MRVTSLILLWSAVLCGGAGVFFAFQVWDQRLTADPDLFYAVAAVVLLVLGGTSLLALITLHGLAQVLGDVDRVELRPTDSVRTST